MEKITLWWPMHLAVNQSTARGIVARYIREGRIHERPRGGRNNVRVDDEMRDCIEEILNENCLLTLSQINQELRRRLIGKPEIHDRTVARTLDGMLFRVKLARPLPADRNRPDVLQRRRDYANWFMNHAVLRQCVFVDECGYNICIARNYRRARRGERGRNVTVGLAVSPIIGLVFHSAFVGRMNAERLATTVQQRTITPKPRRKYRTELKKLSQYSTFLNIVEQAVSALKAAIKADISRPEVQARINDRDEARDRGLPLGQY